MRPLLPVLDKFKVSYTSSSSTSASALLPNLVCMVRGGQLCVVSVAALVLTFLLLSHTLLLAAFVAESQLRTARSQHTQLQHHHQQQRHSRDVAMINNDVIHNNNNNNGILRAMKQHQDDAMIAIDNGRKPDYIMVPKDKNTDNSDYYVEHVDIENAEKEHVDIEDVEHIMGKSRSKGGKHLLAEYSYDKDQIEQEPSSQNLPAVMSQKSKKLSTKQDLKNSYPVETFIVNVEMVHSENSKINTNHVVHLKTDKQKTQELRHKSEPSQNIKDIPVKTPATDSELGSQKAAAQVVEVNIEPQKQDSEWEAGEDMSLEHLILAADKKHKKKVHKLKGHPVQFNHHVNNNDPADPKLHMLQSLQQKASGGGALQTSTTKAPSANLLKQAKLRLSLQMRKKHPPMKTTKS